jgi:thymidine phosphorylase
VAAWRLGAGRTRREDPVSATAGVVIQVRPGEQVRCGQPVLTLHADDPARFSTARRDLAEAYTIGGQAPPRRPLVLGKVG